MAYQWVDYGPDFIRQRYDRLADIIALFDWLFCIPPGLRRHAVDRLSLKAGDCVLEVGCGSGRNFPFLRAAVGPSGRIYGVDLSAGMLRRARKLRDRHHWTNIRLAEGDAADYVAPEPLDGVLFSFSYNTMPHHLTVLRRMWKQLRPGGRLVIVDSKLPPGLGGKLLLPFSLWLMRHTLLGNPYIRPWEHHAKLVDNFEMQEFLFASYYVCRGVRLLKSRLEMRAPSQRQDVDRDVVGRFRSPLRRKGQRQGTAQANCGRARSRSCRFRRSATAGSSPKLANQRAELRPRGVGQRLHERRRLLSSASARSCNASSLCSLAHSAGRDR
jgi:demethylmenaquinone methyltransferase/2-methoxy-6-polyprenyl-1,4-benzoquinol methylase